MRYKLDVNGYVIAVSFGCYLDGCTEYMGTIPIGYNSLDDWATYSCVNAYYIDHNGNLALDQEKLAECRRKEAQDKVDNAPLVRKDLYESEELLESQYIKATVTGQAINLTDAKVLPPRIKLTNIDPSAYSDIILYVSNGTETREYTILLGELKTVDYILIEKGLVIASVNGNEEIIGEGHIRLFEGVCNIYASEVVTIEIEYSTNVQDVESLEFLQGKSTTSNKFRVEKDGTIVAKGGRISNWKIGDLGLFNDTAKMGFLSEGSGICEGVWYAGFTYDEMLQFAEEGTDLYPPIMVTNDGFAVFRSLMVGDFQTGEPAYVFIMGDMSLTGDVSANSFVQTSQADKKKNFEKLESGLDVLKDIDIYKFNYKTETDEAKKHIGFVIGDGYKYSEIATNKDNTGADVYSLVGVCVKSIQELQAQVQELEQKLKEKGI